jgi:IclR family transcriptional regulator, pca regulon regulatory protein
MELLPTAPPGLPKGNDLFVEAFARGLRVIRVFGLGHNELTLSEVAERAELTPAGARRLLHTLVTLGYARVNGRTFSLTPAVLDLGYSYLSSLSLRDVARPYLEQFAKEHGEICSLAVLDRADIIYVARAEIRGPSERRVTIGERLPAHATSSGHVLLAALGDKELDDYLAHAPFERVTPNTVVQADRLKEAIRVVREKRFAFSNQQLVLGICGLAVPVRDREGRTVAALATSLNTVKHPPEQVVDRFLPVLKEIAAKCVVG